MKWRCEWCGKPQERNDPPCDNCGHHSFERAVVPKAPDETHEEVVWLCPECGRTSPKHNPPCSRCGNMRLQRRSADYLDPGEINGSSYRDLLEWWHLVLGVVIVVLGAIVALGIFGVVDLPGAPTQPSVDNPPGSADSANGISLPAVEEAFVEKLNEQRTQGGIEAVERDSTFQSMATYYNQRLVEAEYADGSRPGEGWAQPFNPQCSSQLFLATMKPGTISSYETADGLAETVLSNYNSLENQASNALGIDVHVGPDGSIFVTSVLC